MSRLPLILAIALSLIGLGLSGSACADVIEMKDGSTLEGEILTQDGTTIRIRINASAVVEIKAKDVRRIIAKPTRGQIYAKKHAALGAKDIAGRIELAKWCRKNFLPAKSRELFGEILKIDPDHAVARARLGYVRHKGQWVDEADYYKSIGYVRHRGRWVPKAEAERAKRRKEIDEIIKLGLRAIRKGGADTIEGERSILELKKDPIDADLAGPILVEELEDQRRAAVRKFIVRALGELSFAEAALPLLEIALEDDEMDVAEAATAALWALPARSEVVEARTKIVQTLFHKYRSLRRRAASLLGAAGDPASVPYLIEALYLKRLKRVQVTDDVNSQGISRVGNGARGAFGTYNRPLSGGFVVRKFRTELQVDLEFNRAARAALRKITGMDFDYAKDEWFEWWNKQQAAGNGAAGGASAKGVQGGKGAGGQGGQGGQGAGGKTPKPGEVEEPVPPAPPGMGGQGATGKPGAGGKGSAGKTPEGKAPEGKTPEGKTPEGKTPEGKTPEGKTPEGKTPEGKTPEAGGDEADRAKADGNSKTSDKPDSEADNGVDAGGDTRKPAEPAGD